MLDTHDLSLNIFKVRYKGSPESPNIEDKMRRGEGNEEKHDGNE